MAKEKATLDRSRPFATRMSLKPQKGIYTQDGIIFDADGKQCGKTDGYDRLQEQKVAVEKAAAPKSDSDKALDRAMDVLGEDLESGIDVRRENAATAAAENLADDA